MIPEKTEAIRSLIVNSLVEADDDEDAQNVSQRRQYVTGFRSLPYPVSVVGGGGPGGDHRRGHHHPGHLAIGSKSNNNYHPNIDAGAGGSAIDDYGGDCSAEDRELVVVADPLFENIESEWAPIEPSLHARNTINPIRRIVDVMNVEPNPDKPLLKLHIGDPSVAGILPTHERVNAAVVDAVASGRYNGYGPAVGFQHVREALAKHINDEYRNKSSVDADDIVLTSGCSHALQMAIEALAGPGMNILVPKPGFPLYVTLMRPHDIEERYYDLRMDKGWEADLDHMESLIDNRTAAIIVNNPNNPTGAVYSREHLEDILKLAQKYRVPIIADEIYGDMVFGGAEFHPMHTLRPKVPILTCDGISKRYLVPGWRLGWLIVHDDGRSTNNAFRKVRAAVRQLAQKIVGPCALMQGALPAILRDTPREFFQRTSAILAANVDVVCAVLATTPGVRPVRAQGAMYMMIGLDHHIGCFPEFDSEEALITALISEQSLYCLPGSAFSSPGAIRFVLTHTSETIREACVRLSEFARRHYHPTPQPPAKRNMLMMMTIMQQQQRRASLAGNGEQQNDSSNTSKILRLQRTSSTSSLASRVLSMRKSLLSRASMQQQQQQQVKRAEISNNVAASSSSGAAENAVPPIVVPAQ